MDSIKTNTYGHANSAALKASYALAKNDPNGRESYWVGGFCKNGSSKGKTLSKPQSSVIIDNAIIFPSKGDAYNAANTDDRLHYHRVVPVLAKVNNDGFRSRWWVGRDPGR
jgi:hypothetical protein